MRRSNVACVRAFRALALLAAFPILGFAAPRERPTRERFLAPLNDEQEVPLLFNTENTTAACSFKSAIHAKCCEGTGGAWAGARQRTACWGGFPDCCKSLPRHTSELDDCTTARAAGCGIGFATCTAFTCATASVADAQGWDSAMTQMVFTGAHVRIPELWMRVDRKHYWPQFPAAVCFMRYSAMLVELLESLSDCPWRPGGMHRQCLPRVASAWSPADASVFGRRCWIPRHFWTDAKLGLSLVATSHSEHGNATLRIAWHHVNTVNTILFWLMHLWSRRKVPVTFRLAPAPLSLRTTHFRPSDDAIHQLEPPWEWFNTRGDVLQRLLLTLFASVPRRRTGLTYVEVGVHYGFAAGHVAALLGKFVRTMHLIDAYGNEDAPVYYQGPLGKATADNVFAKAVTSMLAAGAAWPCDAQALPACEANVCLCRADDARVLFHRRLGTLAAKTIPDGSADLVFIDANHDYMSVSNDLRDWWPKVAKGGHLAGHDFLGCAGVTHAVLDFFGGLRPRPDVFLDSDYVWYVFKP